MSGQAFHKILCGHCAGRIEFPAEYAGQTIQCPHCQKPVQLIAPAAAIPLPPEPVTPPAAQPATTPPATAAPVDPYDQQPELTPEQAAKGKQAKKNIMAVVLVMVGINLAMGLAFLMSSKTKPGAPLEGVKVTDWKLEPGEYKTYYVTGTLKNTTSKPVDKARVEFETLDSFGNVTGTATTLVSNLAPDTATSFSITTSPTQSVWDAKVKGVFTPEQK